MSHHGGRAFHGSGHGKQKREEAEKENVELAEDEEEEEDPFDTRIKKSGCADLHYALLVSAEPHFFNLRDRGSLLFETGLIIRPN